MGEPHYSEVTPSPWRVFYVDNGRTDTYIENGRVLTPYKTIQAAVNKVIANGDNTQAKPYALIINPGVYAENVVLESAALKSLIFIGMGSRLQTQISPASGNALQSNANNDNLYDLHMQNIQFNKPTSMIGASNNTFFGYNFFFSNVYWSATAPAVFKNMTYPTILTNISKLSGGVTFSNVTLATVSEMGGIKTGSFVVETDESANKPYLFSGGTKVNVQDGAYPNCTFSLLNIVALTGTTLQVRVARYGSTGQTIPANASILAYNSTLLGNYVNNGTLTLYNSIVSGALTGTAPILYQPASQHNNDSIVPGTTIKDALDTILASGITGTRPAVKIVGQMFFDTTLGYPIWWDGAQWIDAAGNPV